MSGMVEIREELTLEQFIQKVPDLHDQYLTSLREQSKPVQVMEVERRIQQKASEEGALDKTDIKLIVRWGLGFRLIGHVRKNDNEDVRHHTAQAIEAIKKDDPETALSHVRRIGGLGPSFAPKVLAFLSPQTCPVLDDYIKDCLSKADNPPRDYTEFIELLRYIAKRLEEQSAENPRRTGGAWYMRDIEMALYRFAYGPHRKRTPGRYITGKLLYRQ